MIGDRVQDLMDRMQQFEEDDEDEDEEVEGMGDAAGINTLAYQQKMKSISDCVRYL